jgi:argininosuccinate lyase
MQEDKEPVFDTVENLMVCVQAMTGMVLDFAVNKEKMEESASEAYANATDLADWLVRELKLPFRDAHHVTARLVKLASGKGKKLEELSLKEMETVEPKIRKDVFSVLATIDSVKSRTSFGGTAPANVRAAIAEAKKHYLK